MGGSANAAIPGSPLEAVHRNARRRRWPLAQSLRLAGALGRVDYDQTALDAAWDLCRDWTNEEREYLRAETPKTALDTPFRNGTVLDIAREMIAIAETGLKNRARENGIGEDETIFLAELREIAESGKTRAQELLEAYEGRWAGDIDKVYGEMSY